MTDSLSSDDRSKRMSLIRSRDTQPELVVRRLLHNLGYRYKLHSAGLPGKPDIVFPSRRKAVFINGCFWHWHPDPTCRVGHIPLSRTEYWTAKLSRTRARDDQVRLQLQQLGWEFLTIWECELKDSASMTTRLLSFLGPQMFK